MADQESILFAQSGMDQDDSPINFPNGSAGVSPFTTGSYRYAKNVRVGSAAESNVGAVENIGSTLLNETYFIWSGSAWIAGTAPVGTNKALGRCEDIAGGRVFWAVCNVNVASDHTILMWVKSERRIYELLRWDGLSFNQYTLVSMCLINKYLIFTDGLETYSNPPRMINVETIYILKNTLGANFNEYHISLAKWAPLAPPFISFTLGAKNLYLQKGLFQYAYRYVFYGGLKSTWSPPSNFVTFQNDADIATLSSYLLSIEGFIFDYGNPTNTYFNHSSIKFYSVVQYIEFGYRQSTTDPWKQFKRYTVDTGNNDNVSFLNNGPTASIAQVDIGQYFDSVPFFSKACEAIDNRPMLGNNVDDLALTTFRVENVEVYSINKEGWTGPIDNAHGWTGLSGAYQNDLSGRVRVAKYSFKERGIYKLAIQFQHWTGRTALAQTTDEWTYIIPTGPSDNFNGSEQLHALGFKISSDIVPPIWAVGYQILRSNVLNFEFFMEGYVNNFKFLAAADNTLTDWVKTPDEIKTIQNDFYNASGPTSSLALANRILSAIRKSAELPDTIDAASKAGLIYMDISNWVLANITSVGATQDNPNNNLFYNFQQGDRVVFRGSTTTTNPVSPSDLTTFDAEIIEFTGQGILVRKPDDLIGLLKRQNVSDTSTFNMFLIEIYRPKKFADTEVIFNEIGEWYPITKPTTVDRDFTKRDFTWSGESFVTATANSNSGVNRFQFYDKFPITNGDVHIVPKNFYFRPVAGFYTTGSIAFYLGALPNFIQMNPDPLDAGGFWEQNDGRPIVASQYPPVQLTKATQVRFGGKFLEDSLFIAINNFLDANQYIYPSEYGPIRALVNTSNTQVESVGNILLAIGEDTSWSIYVNRVTIDDLGGRTQVGLSDKVLGSYNTLLGGLGTLNGESVSKNNGRVIWWNVKKGTWVRYSRDGLTEISHLYNMNNWFNNLAILLVDYYGSNENPRAISVQDNYYGSWITALDHSSLPSTFRGYSSYKCAEFSEDLNAWSTVFDYLPDVFARLDNDTYSIIGTKIYIHEGGDDFGSFYGVKKDSAIEFISNQQPRQNKVWTNLNLQATDKWSFPSIKGDYRSNGATIQETQLLLANLDEREGLFVSDVLRDQNSVNKTNPIVEGNPMRGRSLDLYMLLDPSVTWLSVFNYLVVGYTMSEKNVKK